MYIYIYVLCPLKYQESCCISCISFLHNFMRSPEKWRHQAPMLDPIVTRSNGSATTETKKPNMDTAINLRIRKVYPNLTSLEGNCTKYHQHGAKGPGGRHNITKLSLSLHDPKTIRRPEEILLNSWATAVYKRKLAFQIETNCAFQNEAASNSKHEKEPLWPCPANQAPHCKVVLKS